VHKCTVATLSSLPSVNAEGGEKVKKILFSLFYVVIAVGLAIPLSGLALAFTTNQTWPVDTATGMSGTGPPYYDLDDPDNGFCAVNDNVDFIVGYEGDNQVFKIYTPDGFEAVQCCDPYDTMDDTAAFFFDAGDDTTGPTVWDGYDFQVMYEPGSTRSGWPTGASWVYDEYADGWHVNYLELGDVPGVSAEKVGDYLVVTVSADKLGNTYGYWPRLDDHTGLYGCTGSPDHILVTPGEIDGMSVGNGGGGCFIATAAYGTEAAAEIDVLRAFRDEVLLENSLGSQLVELYYQTSPPVADFIAENDVLRTIVRELVIDPMVSVATFTQGIWGK